MPDVSIDELNKLYAETRVALVPLLSGAGVKGKVIEAMAKGVPLSGTNIAFEGMPKNADFLYKGNNTASEMTENILYLYSNKDAWQSLSAFGKKYVSENFNKEKIKQIFKAIID